IELTVPNLWRLEAQRGCFLFCPFSDFESFYPVDRIVFPRTSTTRIPPVDRIYPLNKSPLEVLLDQFFQKKAISEANEEWLPLMTGVIHHASETGGYDPNDFTDDALNVLPSWAPSQIRDWIAVPHQRYSATVGENVLELDVPVLATPQLISTAVFRIILHTVYDNPPLRRETMRFVIKAPEYRAPQAIADLEELLPRLWDGLRSLPCDI